MAKQQTTIQLDWRADGRVLEQYIEDRSRVSLIMGPLGSGKTLGSCYKIMQLMVEQEPDADGVRRSRWYAVRNTYPDLMTTTVKDWLGMWSGLGRFVQGGLEPPTHHLDFKLPDGTSVLAEMIFMALDRQDSIKKLRGSQATGFWLNEVKELNKAVIDMADLRHGRYPAYPSWHGMIGDTNAPDTDHWYYELAEKTKPKGWTFYRQAGGVVMAGVDGSGRKVWVENDNAENLRNLPEGYYVNGLEGKSDDWISVNLANEYGFVVDGKAIYPEFSEAVHVRDVEYIQGVPLIIGVDFGLTPAAVIGQMSAMGQLRAIDELVTEDMGALQFGELLQAKLARDYRQAGIAGVYCDPSGDNRDQGNSNSTAIKMLNSKLRGVTAQKASTNDFTARREALVMPMQRLIDGQAGFVISPRCEITIKGLKGGYQYRRLQVAGDERFADVPNKNKYSHPVEAAQYMALGAGMGKVMLRRQRDDNMPRPSFATSDYDMFG